MQAEELDILELAQAMGLYAAALLATARADCRSAQRVGKLCRFAAFELKIVQREAVLSEFVTDFMIYLSENLLIPNI